MGNDLLEKLNGEYLFKVNSGGIWISKFSCLEIQVRASWVFLCGKQQLVLVLLGFSEGRIGTGSFFI